MACRACSYFKVLYSAVEGVNVKRCAKILLRSRKFGQIRQSGI